MNPSSDQTWEFDSVSEASTRKLGSEIAAAVEPNTVIALVGNLGSGKTFLVRAIASAMAIDERDVTSPTFTLIHEYPARLPLYHIDVYRLKSVDDFLDLGAEEIFTAEGVCLIEWADRVKDVLPTERLDVEITSIGDSERRLAFSATGVTATRLLHRLRDRLG